jgi:hypothetical protein
MGGSSHHSLVWPSSAAATYGRYKAKTRQRALVTPKPINSHLLYAIGVRPIELGDRKPNITKSIFSRLDKNYKI